MQAAGIEDKIENSVLAQGVSAFLHSRFFPLLTAAVILACYYSGLDMVSIWYLAVCAIAILITCKDVTPMISLFLFMNIIISMENSPSNLGNESDYYLQPVIYIQIIVAISAAVLTLAARLCVDIIAGRFRPSPMFYGLCALSGALLLNGAFSKDYNPLNFVYGLFLSAMFIGIFMLISGNISPAKKTFEQIAFYFACFAVVLCIELTVVYATYEGLIVDGTIVRSKIFLGWGMYNTIGMLLCICIPAWFYLALTQKFGFVYTVLGMGNICAAFLAVSRQSMIGAAIVGVACLLWLIICSKGRERFVHIVLIVVTLACAGSSIGALFDEVMLYFKSLGDNFMTGSGRIELWKRAVKYFEEYPIFGIGFFGGDLSDYAGDFIGLDIIPLMYHNTVIQMFAACGLTGLIAYIIHRIQTIISFFRNITRERIFIVMTGCVFLILCLFDNHLFYLFPTLVYTALVAVLKASEKREEKADTKQGNKAVKD